MDAAKIGEVELTEKQLPEKLDATLATIASEKRANAVT
jgi:hypothetical protein